jgi:hypothetical protein
VRLLFGEATLDFTGLTMRAACNLRRHDAASGVGRQVYAGADIDVYGMTGSVATPATGFAKFHFGLSGTFRPRAPIRRSPSSHMDIPP